MECEFCKKGFSTKSNLTAHQKSAVYCLELQGKENKNFVCEYCSKTFTLHKTLNEHILVCKEKQKKEKESLDNYYKELSKKLEKYQGIEKKLEEKNKENKHLKDKLQEKNEYISKLETSISKLETKLEKFENAYIDVNKNKSDESDESDESDSDNESDIKPNIPLSVSEKLNTIFIDNIKQDDIKTPELSNIIINDIMISSRPLDHYVNATQLCQAGGKKFSHWLSLDTTTDLINQLSIDAGIPASILIETKRGGNKLFQGSWIHPDLSIQLAQWISPKVALQVSKWIRTLFTKGSIEIDVNLLREKERDIKIKDDRIKKLESVCLSKQRRIDYPERNVIYLLTTADHVLRRTYIIGKAKNLTSRLGTYNKTCDHSVVHYRECKSEDDMDIAETMVLNKLKDYREQANRDRFILPEESEVEFFISTINNCISFLD